MTLLTKMYYSFVSIGMDKKTFTVVNFKGFESICKPFEFHILHLTKNQIGDDYDR